MLNESDRELLVSVLEAPRRAHNLNAHRAADALIDAELNELYRGDALMRTRALKLAVKVAAVPPTPVGECIKSAFTAGKILELQVQAVEKTVKTSAVRKQ